MFLTAFIDLTDEKVTIEKSPQREVQKFLGSRGYAAKLLYDNVGPEVEPFSEKNHLIFSTGMFTGTAWPTSARFTVTAKSPLTEAYGCSNSGGLFGPELRRAGYDALVIKGRASRPVYLYVEDDEIEILQAEEYWGEKVGIVDDNLSKKHHDSQVACIGPAGENKVRFAAIMTNGARAAGRTGMGAVMGSKNLKAVVVKASGKVDFPEKFRKTAIRKAKKLKDHPSAVAYRKWGTPILTNYKNGRGDLPARNHQEVQVEDQNTVNAQAVDKYVYDISGCYACPIRCSRHSRVESGPYECETEGPEYETVNSFGPMLDNDNMELIIYANNLCDELGIDTISTGVVISFAMECKQRGYLKDENLSLEWGDEETIVKMIKKIAHRDGVGDILAEGVKRASSKIDPATKEFALHVKGMETPHQEPRANRSLALGHATSNRGACHMYGLSTIGQTRNEEMAEKYFPDSDEKLLDVFSQKHKHELIKLSEDFSAVTDSLGICKFSTLEGYALEPEDLAEGLNAYCEEFDYDMEKLLQAGERIVALERMYNYRHGLSRKDDTLPGRFTEEPIDLRREDDEGRLTDEVYVKDLVVDLDEMLDKYYDLRDWSQNGVPTAEKLRELDLDELVEDLAE